MSKCGGTTRAPAGIYLLTPVTRTAQRDTKDQPTCEEAVWAANSQSLSMVGNELRQKDPDQYNQVIDAGNMV